MSSGAAQTWFIVGTIPLMLAGGLHAVLTVLDAVRPTFFTPVRDSTRQEMEAGGMRFKAVFGLLCRLIATHDFGLVERIGGLRALSIAIPTAYLATSLFFWFYIPSLVVGAATACFIVSAVLAG